VTSYGSGKLIGGTAQSWSSGMGGAHGSLWVVATGTSPEGPVDPLPPQVLSLTGCERA